MSDQSTSVADKDTEQDVNLFKGHLDLVNMNQLSKTRVLMIGAGSIGSFAALAMVKMGVGEIVIFDDDKIEPHNFANQLYPYTAMGVAKIDVLRKILTEMGANKPETGVKINLEARRFIDTDLSYVKQSDIVICAVDNMATRILLWEMCKKSIHTSLYVDCRIGGTQLDCFALESGDPDDIDFFESKDHEGKSNFLYSSKETVQLKCTEKSIIFPVMFSAGWISTCVYHYANNTIKRLPRSITYMMGNLNIPSSMVSR